jgi:two-component system NtrC family sensor kinase
LTERRNLERRLLEAELLASVGMLAAAVNHEINNPLAFLMLGHHALQQEITALAAEGGILSAERHGRMLELASELAEGTSRISTIARDFKMLTRVREDALELVDLGVAIPAAIRIATPEVRHRAQVRLLLSPVPRIKASEGRIAQLILNLVVNAAQALPAGGNHAIQVSTSLLEGTVVVDVEDDGPGVPAEIASRVFEPFFTTKRDGSGLGLSICQGIVSGFGGSIELLRSALGGALFRLRFPLAG